MQTVESTVDELQESERPTPAQTESTGWRGPLFVIGMWRSGTSLLYALLNKHPEIALLYEGDLLMLGPLFWLPGGTRRKLERWDFWNQALQRHRLGMNEFSNEDADIRSIAEKGYREYANHRGAKIGGDKSPNYFDSLTRLSEIFPEARFIVIWRDPASICRSVIRAAQGVHSWFDRKGMALRVLLGMEAMRIECDRLVQRGACLHELQYDSLVRNPVETMQGICRFLEIPFVPEMASLEGADRSAIYEGGHHELVKGERIIAAKTREEVLPDKLKSKIARYLGLWQEQYGDRWPVIASQQKGVAGRASVMERLFDGFRYRCLRLLDAIIVATYCYAPLWILNRFRGLKHEREEARARMQAQASSKSSVSDSASATSSK